MIPKTLDQWLTYIQTIHARSKNIDLDRVREVKNVLGLKRRPVVISVGGTNAKGSSVGLMESVLCYSGVKVGAFTSPHLIRYQERIKIGGSEISEKRLLNIFGRVEEARSNIPLTFFEFGTIAALFAFEEDEVDVAILEVGLGGRLDAVNTENQDITLLTPISLDHQEWLGQDRESIGLEKAGILKVGGKLVINDLNPPNSVINKAQSLGCETMQYGIDYLFEDANHYWNWVPKNSKLIGTGKENQLPLPKVKGEHQLMNAAGVITVLKSIKNQLPVPRVALEKGLKSQFIRGRLEILQKEPEIILDIAHNKSAAKNLREFLISRPITGATFAVFSALKDKPVKEIVQICSSVIDIWYITELSDKRAMSLDSLKNTIQSVHAKNIVFSKTPHTAFVAACEKAGASDRIVVFGSTYLAGDIMAFLDSRNASP